MLLFHLLLDLSADNAISRQIFYSTQHISGLIDLYGYFIVAVFSKKFTATNQRMLIIFNISQSHCKELFAQL